MGLDWNWFYAAFAQSLAAVIAIFGAFTASKLIDKEARGRELRNKVEHLLGEARAIARRIRARYPDWLVERRLERATNRLAEYFEEILEETDEVDLDQAFLDTYSYFSEYTPPDRIRDALYMRFREVKAEVEAERRRRAAQARIGLDLSGVVGGTVVPAPRPGGANLATRLEEEEDKVHELFARAQETVARRNSLREQVEAFNEGLNGMRPIFWALLFLFLGAVVFPLSVLPTNGVPTLEFRSIAEYYSSLRGLLILIATFGGGGFFAYFLHRLQLATVEDNELPEPFFQLNGPGDLHAAFQNRVALEEHIQQLAEAQVTE